MGTLRGNVRELTRIFDGQYGLGQVFFVDTINGASGNAGTSPEFAKATIAQALALCTADRGDVIVVLSASTFTISAAGGIDLSVAGVKIVGLGKGTKKPTITIGTAATADLLVSAARVTLQGFRFVSAIDSLEMFVDVNEGEFTIEDCDFVTSSTFEALCFIDLATTKDDFVIRGCTFIQPTDPGGTDAAVNTGVIYCVDSENILIENCHAYGNFETAFLHNKTTAAKNVLVRNCFIYSALATSVPFELVDGCTGVAHQIVGATPAATDATEALVYGTLGTTFWIVDSGVGNDSGAGGQGGIGGTVAS